MVAYPGRLGHRPEHFSHRASSRYVNFEMAETCLGDQSFELNAARQRSKVACQAPYDYDTGWRINKAAGVQGYAIVFEVQRRMQMHLVLAKQFGQSNEGRKG